MGNGCFCSNDIVQHQKNRQMYSHLCEMDSNYKALALVNHTLFSFSLSLTFCLVCQKKNSSKMFPVQWLLSCRYFSLAKRYNIIIIIVRICETSFERAYLTRTGWREKERDGERKPEPFICRYTNTENILALWIFIKYIEKRFALCDEDMANDNDHHIIHNTQNEWKATGVFLPSLTLLRYSFNYFQCAHFRKMLGAKHSPCIERMNGKKVARMFSQRNITNNGLSKMKLHKNRRNHH